MSLHTTDSSNISDNNIFAKQDQQHTSSKPQIIDFYSFVPPEESNSNLPPLNNEQYGLVQSSPIPFADLSGSSDVTLDYNIPEDEMDDDFDDYLSTLTTSVKIVHNRSSSATLGSHHYRNLINQTSVSSQSQPVAIKPNSSYGSYLESVRNRSHMTTTNQIHPPYTRVVSSPSSSAGSTFTNDTLGVSTSASSISPSSSSTDGLNRTLGSKSLTPSASRSTLSTHNQHSSRSLHTETTNLSSSESAVLYSSYQRLPSMGSKSPLRTTLTFVEPSSENGKKNQQSSILKQYTNGDLVSCQITISNGTENDVRFEELAVWIEGSQYTIADRLHGIVKKRVFLRLDSESEYEENSTSEFELRSIMSNTSGKTGISSSSSSAVSTSHQKSKKKKITLTIHYSKPSDQIVKSYSMYVFKAHFRLPYTESHLPPTLSLYNHHQRFGPGLEIDPDLKYGFNFDERMSNGSPVIVDDLSWKNEKCSESGDVSVQYTVNFMIIGSEYENLDKRTEIKKRDVKLSSLEAYFRFVPYDYGVNVGRGLYDWLGLQSRVQGQIGHFDGATDNHTQIKPFEIPSAVFTQCHYRNSDQSKGSLVSSSGSKYLNKLKLHVKNSSSSTNRTKSATTSHGVITIASTIPSSLTKIRYTTPSVFEKINQWYNPSSTTESNVHGLRSQQIYNKLESHVSNLSSLEEFQELTIDLKYVLSSKPGEFPLSSSQSDRFASTSLPQVDSVTVRLIAIDYHSTESPLPFEISSELLAYLNQSTSKSARSRINRDHPTSKSKSRSNLEEDFTLGLRTQAQKLMKHLASEPTSDRASANESLPKCLVQELQTLTTITSKARQMSTPLYDSTTAFSAEATQTQWMPINSNQINPMEPQQNAYNSKLSIPLTNPLFSTNSKQKHNFKHLIIPNYQLGIAGRCYLLRCSIKFDGFSSTGNSSIGDGSDVVLDIPVQVGLW